MYVQNGISDTREKKLILWHTLLAVLLLLLLPIRPTEGSI
jgi:hypothetical protein